MDRLSFLKSMLVSTALLTLPPLKLLSSEEQQHLSTCTSIKLLPTHVRKAQTRVQEQQAVGAISIAISQ